MHTIPTCHGCMTSLAHVADAVRVFLLKRKLQFARDDIKDVANHVATCDREIQDRMEERQRWVAQKHLHEQVIDQLERKLKQLGVTHG